MKKRFLTFLLAGLGFSLHAEHHYILSGALPNMQDYHYTADSHIVLNPGFLAAPLDGHEVLLCIDAYRVDPPQTGLTGGPFSNQDGVVGAIPGMVDVGLLGAATYTIPIELPEGLGKMKPQLAVVYNSQGRNGLLGWGWELAGVSAITRAGNNLFYDGVSSPVNYLDDRFYLDGQRLLQVNGGTYGEEGVSYRTEQDQMRKIVSHQTSGINGTAYFEVWEPDGNLLLFGSSDDSKALKNGQNQVHAWLLKQITDRYGNEITYHYDNAGDHYTLERISYSGNSNQQLPPAFSIEFQYSIRSDITWSFYGNQPCQQAQLLDRILVKNGGHECYQYQFHYQPPQPQNGYPYTLLKEIGFVAGNQHYNPTLIQWGDNNYPVHSSPEVRMNVTTEGIPNAFINAVKFSGDFNGDGYTDVLSVQPDGNGHYSTAELFLNQGVSGTLVFEHHSSFPLGSQISWVNIADCNGDGMDDLIFCNRIRNPFPFPDVIDTDIYLGKTRIPGQVEFDRYTLPNCYIPRNRTETMLIGDFLGEGRHSILIQSVESGALQNEFGILFRYDPESDVFIDISFSGTLSADRIYPADYNGDGITELLYKDSDGHTRLAQLRMNDGHPYYQMLSQSHPADWDECFPGDFNGDGLTDCLFYEPEKSRPWKICLADPTGFSALVYRLPDHFPYQSPGDTHFTLDQPNHTSHYLKIGDFDGNGCADIALYYDNRFYAFYGPMGSMNGSDAFSYSHQISTTLFNLVDNMNVCLGNFLGKESLSFLGNNTVSFLPVFSQRHEVRRITDGMGRKTELTYNYLLPNPRQRTDDDFYRLSELLSDESKCIYSVPLPLRAVQSVTTYHTKNQPTTIQCYYEGALLHKKGKGFLGFTATRQDDYCQQQRQKKTIRNYTLIASNNLIHTALEKEEVFDSSDQLMARSTYSNQYYFHQRNNKVYIHLADKTSEAYDVNHPAQLLKKEISATTVSGNGAPLFQYNDFLHVTEYLLGTTSQPQIVTPTFCEYQSKTLTQYMDDLPVAWLGNRPQTVTRIQHHEGDEDLIQQTTYHYHPCQPYQLQLVIECPFDGSEPDWRLARTTEYEFDPMGNLISQTLSAPYTDLEPRRESFEYGPEYGCLLLTKHTDAAGNETHYRYDPVYHHCTSVTDWNGLETQFEQDPMGITQTTRHPDGTVRCKALRWSGSDSYEWEKKTGQATQESCRYPTGEPYWKRAFDLNGNAAISTIEYDALGHVIKQNLPHAPTASAPSIHYDYNAHHQVERITHPDGTYETLLHDGHQTSTTRYDLDKSTQTESKTVNVMGWTIRSTDANGTSVLYDYYPDGKPKWAQIEGHRETRIEMAYDGWRNRTFLYDPNYGETHSEYDAFGLLTSRTTPLNHLSFEYDLLGNLVKRTETEGYDGPSKVTRWHYSQAPGQRGQLQAIESENQTVHYQYDSLQRLVKTEEILFGTCYTTYYRYDKASRLESMTYPSGFTVHYSYTAEGALHTVLDASLHRLWRLDETNAMNQPLQITLGNSIVTQYGYGEAHQKLVSIHTHRDGQILQDDHYDYDGFGNMISRNDLVAQHSETFTYDALNRLTSARCEEGTSTFLYDALGRMTHKTDHGNLLYTNADYSGFKPYTLKSAETPDGVFPPSRMTIQYNLFNKASTLSEGPLQVTYDYGHDQQRIRVTEQNEGHYRQKVYANACEFIDETGRPPVTRTFLSGPFGVFAVAETIQGQTELHYIHKDHLGSWTLVTDPNGTVEQINHFDAWGRPEWPGELRFDRGFTGHEHIRGLGLINMNGRLYDPITSSMLSPDNYVQTPDDSQNLNRYAYCLNNPLSFTDPDGESFIENALLFYLFFCTDMGYELQKFMFPLALHLDLHLSTQQLGIGADCSFGIPKASGISIRGHWGASYYWRYYDNSYQGWEFRVGSELCVAGFLGYAGTCYFSKGLTQTTNSIIVGNWLGNVTYENDHMFHIGEWLPGILPADNGDRYRSAAVRLMFGPLSVGVSLFTGDPGLNHRDRKTYEDPEANHRETYTLNDHGDDPDRYRAGIAYVGLGPVRWGINSEKVRDFFQNKLAHDFLCQGDSPYFKVLDRPRQNYFYFGTGTGGNLW